jgi:hypothetical protein
MLVVVAGCANANVTRHECRNIQPRLRDFLFFLATDEAFFPKAVRTDFGKCVMVRFLFAADAALLMFFLAAVFCFLETTRLPPFTSSFGSGNV